MQVSKLIVALTVAAGFASASFAQGTAVSSTPAASTAKVAAPAPAAAEKKIEAPKAAPAKAELAQSEVKTATPKADAGKPAETHAKAKVRHEHKGEKPVAKLEVKPEAKLAAAPVTK